MKVEEILKDCSEWIPGKEYETAKPIVSVLLPTFRRAESGLFEAAVRSVLEQDFKELELIIIDDASTDGTAELIRSFMQQDPRVSCIRHTFNVGLPAISEYEGYLRARGEYIAFMFDDNEWELDFVGKTVSYMDRNHAKVSYGKMKSFYSADQFVEFGDTDSGMGMFTLLAKNHIQNGSIILAREVIETVGLYDPHMALTRLCDWDLWKRVFDEYEFFETGISAGKEQGVSLPDSLGNSYKMNYWISAEREQSRDKKLLLPSNFHLIEIDEVLVQTDNSGLHCGIRREIPVNSTR